jgi:hypothetical protein
LILNRVPEFRPPSSALQARRRLLIGPGARAQKVLACFAGRGCLSQIIGFLDDDPALPRDGILLGVPRIGNIQALNSVLDMHIVDEVIVALL